MIAVIMQPTYLPWIGYFDLMDKAGVFVFLDNVQFEKQAWQQRNRIKSSDGQWKWLTVPVVQNISQHINEVRIDNTRNWSKKHWKTIEQYYLHAPCWKQYSPGLEEIYSQKRDFLVDLNLAIITYIKNQFKIETKLVKASDLPVTGSKVRRLVNICHHLNADVYLSSVRSADYIEQDNMFESEGISLRYHQFEHPLYSQLYGDFASNMSAIDLLFNEGPKSLDIIHSGSQPY